MPTCGELRALLESVQTAMAWGYADVNSVSVRVCVFLAGQPWAVSMRTAGREVGAIDASGAPCSLAELNARPHVYAETAVKTADRCELIEALATATLEDLSVQLERVSPAEPEGTTFFRPCIEVE